ncbi:hypothetical protein RJ640_020973 [Escallonia rubra]|uniref:ZF-HD dimerization-type domain-containing protein n=1 Tax=Escallonia rubra TaxID=112253 RepID=A0AA88UPI4_9ASTE|nr:hypothetical protein RJ640_020973 [Escallonia rubra]
MRCIVLVSSLIARPNTGFKITEVYSVHYTAKFMALMSGPEKDIRMQGAPLAFRESSQTLDQGHHHQLQPPDQPTQQHKDRFPAAASAAKLKMPTKYRECLKNHAANMGGNVTDGCGEFMPSGEDGTLEALMCAACNCHRNFHRKEADADANFARSTTLHHHHHHPLQLPPQLTSPTMNHHQWNPSIVPPVKMAFGGGTGNAAAATDSSSEELNFNAFQSSALPLGSPPFGLSKKRHRTKFTQEQKGKMLEFAERVGWRIPREDDAEVQRLCAELGVKRQVLKVWMHNNKSNSLKKLPQEACEGEG